MLSQKQIKIIRNLQQKKFRNEYGLFVVEGEKMVTELLSSGMKVKSLYYTDKYQHGQACNAEDSDLISDSELKKISSLKNPNNCLAIVYIPEIINCKLESGKPYLVLDKIQDPGNLGTIVRTADWFGIDTVFCSEDTVDLYNPKTVQSTMGSLFRVKVVYTDLISLFSKASSMEISVLGTVLDGVNMYNSEIPKCGLWVIGNEANGISDAVKEKLDHKVRIPSYPEDSNVESLNASIATALICSEIRRPN